MFVSWALVVSGSPAITHTEKPMDFMLLNSAHQARFFPAEDAWLSGHSISYYYFGHIIFATLAKMSGVVTSTAYNLGVATVPALASILCFGLLYNLVRMAGQAAALCWALGHRASLAPVVVLLAGNLTWAHWSLCVCEGGVGPGFWDWVGNRWPGLLGRQPPEAPVPWRLLVVVPQHPRHKFTIADGETCSITPLPSSLLSASCWGTSTPMCWPSPSCTPCHVATASQPVYRTSRDRAGTWHWVKTPPRPGSWMVALSGGALAFINFWDFPTFTGPCWGRRLVLKALPRLSRARCSMLVNAAAAVFLPRLPPVCGTVRAGLSHDSVVRPPGCCRCSDVATRPVSAVSSLIGPFIRHVGSTAGRKSLLSRIRRPEGGKTPRWRW